MPKTKTKKPPGHSCLVPVLTPTQTGPKCEHNTGSWCVLWNGALFAFDPSTQLQKDLWLGDVKQKIGEDGAVKLLRWWCNKCGTIQEP